MKKLFLIVSFICISNISFSQTNEIGFFVGESNYVGDIGRTNYIYPNKLAGGLFYKYNYNSRIAFRIAYSYIPIKANDANASNPYRAKQKRSFINTINEIALGMEFNFFEYNIFSLGKKITPYILVEIAGFNYKSPQSITTSNKMVLENKISYALPFGLGIKGKLSDNIAFAVEIKARYTFKDDLDYSTTKIPALNFGGTGNDWYMFSGISFAYTFGRPPCYAPVRQ